MHGSSGTGGQAGSRPDTNEDSNSGAGSMSPRSPVKGRAQFWRARRIKHEPTDGGPPGFGSTRWLCDKPRPRHPGSELQKSGWPGRWGDTRSREGKFGSDSDLHRPANSLKNNRPAFLPSPSTSYNATHGWFPQVRQREVSASALTRRSRRTRMSALPPGPGRPCL